MRRLLAVSLFVFLPWATQARVNTSEGRVQQAAPATPDASRVSNYSSASSGTDGLAIQERAGTAETSARKHTASATVQTYRSTALAMSPRASSFRIYDAGSTLRTAYSVFFIPRSTHAQRCEPFQGE